MSVIENRKVFATYPFASIVSMPLGTKKASLRVRESP
jgi:hypothetical protein